MPTLEQAESKRFGRERVAVAVDDDAGNPVAFGVDHPIGVGDVIQFEDVAPQAHRAVEQFVPEQFVRRRLSATEHSDGNFGLRVEVAETERLVLLPDKGD